MITSGKRLINSASLSALALALLPANAWAQAGPPQGAGLGAFVPLILIMVIFYFLLIRPQQKRAKEHKAMVDAVKRGDRIITAGGILGTVADTKEDIIKVEIASGVKVSVKRDTISGLASSEK